MTTQLSRPTPEPSIRIVHAVAHALDVDPFDLTPPLGRVVDTDALDEIIAAEHADGIRVSLEYADCTVTVHSDGDIDVETLQTAD